MKEEVYNPSDAVSKPYPSPFCQSHTHVSIVHVALANPIGSDNSLLIASFPVQRSPFTCEGTYMGILNILVAMQSQGVQVSGLVEACKQLADAQSRRSAVAAQILPVVHWVSLHQLQ